MPATHCAPAAHAAPHAPQFAASEERSAHAVPQGASPLDGGQMQSVPRHVAGATHARPHAPQLAPSLSAAVMQRPLHTMPSHGLQADAAVDPGGLVVRRGHAIGRAAAELPYARNPAQKYAAGHVATAPR